MSDCPDGPSGASWDLLTRRASLPGSPGRRRADGAALRWWAIRPELNWSVVLPAQLELFGTKDLPALAPRFEGLARIALDADAWVEYLPGFLTGQAHVFEVLRSQVRWRQEQRVMYDKTVVVPRLYATLPESGPVPLVLNQARHVLGERYGEGLPRISVGYYRDGRDSVAWHGDYVARNMDQAVVATISLGAPRAFWLRSRRTGEKRCWTLGFGDLFVMGGSCQRAWEHSVPKQKHALPRISVMFRGDWG